MPPAENGAPHRVETASTEPGRTGSGLGEPSDAELIERSRREPDCFAMIFDRHADEILRYAHTRLGPDLAEDVTAETFLAAFRRRDSYDTGRADARPWLYGIAIRLIGKHRRSEARYRRMLQATPADRATEDPGDRSADRVTAQQLRPRIAAVLNGLPGRDRELLLLIAWAGLSYEESAQALGISTSAVRSRLNRIRVRTRKELGGANPARLHEENDRG
ncbi:MAG TPA: RNA polymerase sigma factor [Streptosporangiaceae bacterium]